MGPTLAHSHIIQEESAVLVSLSVCNMSYVLPYSGWCDHVIVWIGFDVADYSQA